MYAPAMETGSARNQGVWMELGAALWRTLTVIAIVAATYAVCSIVLIGAWRAFCDAVGWY